MPLLYGEGERAFIRLQEEILRQLDDGSILAWGLNTEARHPLGLVPDVVVSASAAIIVASPLLAALPKDFEGCGVLKYAARTNSVYTVTNLGLQIEIPLVPIFPPRQRREGCVPSHLAHCWVGILSCLPCSDSELVGIVLSSWSKFDRDKRMRRVSMPYESGMTFIVGSRGAAQSTLEKVTIIKSYWINSRDVCEDLCQIVVNPSRTLQDMRFQVTKGAAIQRTIDRRWVDMKSAWDRDGMLLTVPQRIILDGICFFEFQRHHTDSGSTLFMCASPMRAVVNTGPSCF